jgi:hypothetical protein
MSDGSFNPSIESPIDDPTAWDTTDALPVPPPLGGAAAIDAVALAPAVSPRSALAILDGHTNDHINPDALRAIARGLTVTLQQREAYYVQQRRRNEQRIKDLERRVGAYEEVFDSVPEGYEENNGRLPHLAIPIGDGRYKGAKYIKQLEGGWVGAFTDEDGPHSTPHITELFASPAYNIDDTTDDPAEPMPPWFRRILFGHAALFATMQKAILDLDDWGLYAEVSRHRAYDIELGTILGQIERLHLDAEAVRTAREVCEGRLTSAHAYKRLNRLSSSVGPAREHRKTVAWAKKPKYHSFDERMQA